MLENNGSSLTNTCPKMCPDDIIIRDGSNELIMKELLWQGILKAELHELLPMMTEELTLIYNEITATIQRKWGGVFFLYG